MKLKAVFTRVLIVLAITSASTSPARATVQLQHTPITSQGAVGFCWSYATMAYLEQLVRQHRDGWLNLSEEYIGLYNMALQMTHGLGQIQEGGEVPVALDEIEKFGLVPEELFPYKSYDAQLGDRVTQALAEYKRSHGLPANAPLSLEQALDLLERALGIRHIPRPTESFLFRGKVYTPRSFANKRVGFRRADYYTMLIVSPIVDPQLYARQIRLIQKALLYGYSVPFQMALLNGEAGDVTVDGVMDCKECDRIDASSTTGGHVALLTDYRTREGKFGSMTIEQIQATLTQSVEAWAFKNSWGFGPENMRPIADGLNSVRGLPTWGAMTDRYLRASHRMAQSCAACEKVDFQTIYKNPEYAEASWQQAYAVIPSQFVADPGDRMDPRGTRSLYGHAETMILDIDWIQVQAALRSPAQNGAHPGSPADFPLDAPAFRIVPYTGESFGSRVYDLSADNLEASGGAVLAVALQFQGLLPQVKSIALFFGKKNEQGEVVYQDGSGLYVVRSRDFVLHFNTKMPESPKDWIRYVKLQALDKDGRPLGVPVFRTFVIRNLNDTP